MTDAAPEIFTATMTAADGTLLSEANGLMVRLLPPTTGGRASKR